MTELAAEEPKEHLLALLSINTHFALLLKTHCNAITPLSSPSYKSHGVCGGRGGRIKQTHDTYNSVPGFWLATFSKLFGELL